MNPKPTTNSTPSPSYTPVTSFSHPRFNTQTPPLPTLPSPSVSHSHTQPKTHPHPHVTTQTQPAFRHRRLSSAIPTVKQHSSSLPTDYPATKATSVASPDSNPIEMTTTLPTIHEQIHSAMSTNVGRLEEMIVLESSNVNHGINLVSSPPPNGNSTRIGTIVSGQVIRGVPSPAEIGGRMRHAFQQSLGMKSGRESTTSHFEQYDDGDDDGNDNNFPSSPSLPHTHRPTPRGSRQISYNEESAAEQGEATPLLLNSDEDIGMTGVKWYQGPLFITGVKLSILFVIFTVIVLGTFWFGMPKVDPEDKDALKLPRSFADIQALNTIFQKYKNKYPFRILACGVVSYLFVQTFSLPGSMYISILFGAAYGIIYGLILSCLCDSVGSLFCYTLSSLLAPPLLALPYYRARVEAWRTKIMGKPGHEVGLDGVFAFLIVLRIAPFPPHWVANFVAPHLGISMLLFWTTCFIGIAPVSVIHVTIGSSLDKMTSADDFHILSVRNVLGLSGVIVAVLIPVGLKRVFKKDLGELGEAEEALEVGTSTGSQMVGEGEEDALIDLETEILNAQGPVAVEYDEYGVPSKYQAVDSGVLLAGPSGGDPNLDIGNGERIKPDRISKGKGKSRLGKRPNVAIRSARVMSSGSSNDDLLQSIADDVTLDEIDQHHTDHGNHMIKPEKRSGKVGSIGSKVSKGYGTIEPVVQPFESGIGNSLETSQGRSWWRPSR